MDLAVTIGSALGFSLLAWKLRIPTALGQLIAGIIIAPFGLKFITSTATIEGVAEIGNVLHHVGVWVTCRVSDATLETEHVRYQWASRNIVL